MKFSNATKLLCLLLVMALVIGLMIGCRQAQDPTNTTSPTQSSSATSDTDYPSGVYPAETHPTDDKDIWGDQFSFEATPNDTYYELDHHWALDQIGLASAWDITTGSPTIRVGVIDSGVDASHPDLQNRVTTQLSESFVSGVSPLEDSLGHGTHVAGIIGAQGNNGVGVSGVCWNVEIVSLRVSGEDNVPNVRAIIDAIESANSKGIHILNISIVFFTQNATLLNDLYSAIAEFDGLVVCAAGNYACDTDIYPLYPSCLLDASGQDLDNLLSIGNSTRNNEVASDSCFGLTSVDLFAPGASIFNCFPTDLCDDCNFGVHVAPGYHILSGTSMAAPHVAGVAALLLSIHPELTPAELKQIIMSSVDIVYDADANSVFGDKCVSGGRLNAFAALDSALTHDFTSWTSVNGVIHSRTCTTCGYTQTGRHSDSWDALFSRCIVCRYKGIAVAPIESIPPAEDSAA